MKTITLKLFPFLISSLFIFPIIKENFSSLLLILLGLNLILYKISIKDYSFVNLKVFFLTIPFWIISITSIFSSNYTDSLIHIKHSLLFLFFPIVFSLIPIHFFSKDKINLYMAVLKNTCLIIAIIYIYNYFDNVSFREFDTVIYSVSSFRNYIYYKFTLFIIHPTYFTAILILCVSHSLFLVLNQKKYFQILYVFAFVAITFLLITKLTIVLMIITILIMLFNYSGLSLNHKIYSTLFTFFVILVFSIYTPGIKERFEEFYQSFNKAPTGTIYDSTNIRKAIFESSKEICKDNWLKGVGYEKLQENLNETYEKNYESSFFKDVNYMTHNYYFYILLSSGIFGFLFFIYYIKNIFFICFNSKMFLLNILVFNTLILCFIEDYLYRQHGAFYFNLLLMTFIQNTKLNKENQYNSL